MLKNPDLQHGETKSTTRNTDNVVVDGGDQEPEGLGNSLGLGGGGRDSLGGVLGIHAGIGVDADVGQLAVVSRPKWIQADEVQGVGVHVVAGIHGDRGGGVVGLHKGEVVAAHVGETLGVFVDEGGLGNGVGTGEVAGEEEVGAIGGGRAHSGRLGGVVRPVGLDGGVLDGEEQNLDGVGETNVVAGSVGGVVGLGGSGLHLLDEDVAGGTSHALTLIVGDNGVVGPHLHIGEVSAAGVANVGAGGGATGQVDSGATTHGGLHIPSSQQVVETAESEADAHVIVGKGGGGERHTTVAAEEQGQRQVQHLGGEHQGGVNQVAGRANHVGITHLLATGHGEGRPEVQKEAVETSSHQVVESDATLAHKVVGKVGGPRQEGLEGVVGVGLVGGSAGGRHNLGEGEPKPSVQEVVAGTADAHRPLLVEAGRAGRARQTDGHLGEPR